MDGIKMVQDNVLLGLLPDPEMTASGLLFVPKTAKQAPTTTRLARVLAVGPGHHAGRNARGGFIPTTVQAGQTVLVDRVAGQDWTLDNTEPRHHQDEAGNPVAIEWDGYRVVREDEILAVVET